MLAIRTSLLSGSPLRCLLKLNSPSRMHCVYIIHILHTCIYVFIYNIYNIVFILYLYTLYFPHKILFNDLWPWGKEFWKLEIVKFGNCPQFRHIFFLQWRKSFEISKNLQISGKPHVVSFSNLNLVALAFAPNVQVHKYFIYMVDRRNLAANVQVRDIYIYNIYIYIYIICIYM